MHRLDHRPGDGEAVIGRGAAPDLVEDDQAARRRLRQDRGGLDHLDHEGRSAAREIVRRADPAEQAVDQAELARAPRARSSPAWASSTISAFWRRKVDLPPMLGPVISHSRSFGPRLQIVGDEALAALRQRLLDHRMAAALDLQAGLIGQRRRAPLPLGGARGIAGGDVDPGQRVGGGGDRLRPAPRPARSVPRDARPRPPAHAPPASTTRLASSCRSGELKRTTPARVWRWVKPLSGAISRSACRAGTSI